MLTCFNPRICKRCDYESTSINDAGHVSIHASVKDATYKKHGLIFSLTFQSTHL